MPIELAALPWLPEPPADFRDKLKAIGEAAHDHGPLLRNLANHRLNANQLVRLSTLIDDLRRRASDMTPLAPLRLGFLSNGTTDMLVPHLIGSAPRFGIDLSVLAPGFDQVSQQVHDLSSPINSTDLDLILFALDHRGVSLDGCPGDRGEETVRVGNALAYLEGLIDAASRRGRQVIVQTLPPPPFGLFGNAESSIPGALGRMIQAVNRTIADWAAQGRILMLDTAGLAQQVGVTAWHHAGMWNLAKLPFAPNFSPLYADHVCRLLAAARGLSRKCLVLDLDDTLWGGAIGDDGLEGIELGNGSPAGEAFLSIQRMAIDLRRRGIVLAVCSKNDETLARKAFQSHPEMLLREQDIAAFAINWHDKAANVREIAARLNLGLEALVFLDNSPAERAQVRMTYPMVAVPELPDDQSLFPETLLAAGYFEPVAFTDEDKIRADAYQSESRREAVLQSSASLEEFLTSLEMVAVFEPFTDLNRARVTQLINKTNQFNLVARRHTERQVEALQRSPTDYTLAVRLKDRFGDHGLIAVVVCHKKGDVWRVDDWLMSCRVLQRRVEEAILDHISAAATEAGAKRLLGRYVATERNDIVRDHYRKLGFERAGETDYGVEWQLDLSRYQRLSPPIEASSFAKAG